VALRTRDDLRNVAIVAHADFGGEVERGLSLVDAVVLLVDAKPQFSSQLANADRRVMAPKSRQSLGWRWYGDGSSRRRSLWCDGATR
jgi:hypothetical protein